MGLLIVRSRALMFKELLWSYGLFADSSFFSWIICCSSLSIAMCTIYVL